ncbi:MAG: hypothetical protein LBJ08_04135, partial [Bifidobacteriaceae bacterium]|nr:hypothetical protein [Bifidobacteriaceae bacterium]
MTRPVSARPSAPRIVGGTPAPSSADAAPAQRPLSAADTTGSRPPAQGKRPERAAFPAVAATQRGPVGRPTPPREARPVPRAIRERRARAARYRAAIAAALTLLALSGWVLVGI